jgi:hypothetical protein
VKIRGCEVFQSASDLGHVLVVEGLAVDGQHVVALIVGEHTGFWAIMWYTLVAVYDTDFQKERSYGTWTRLGSGDGNC